MRSNRSALRILLLVVLVLGALGVTATGAHAAVDPGAEADYVGRTNALRAQHGLPALEVNPVLVAKARAWAQHMADVGAISHSNLSDGVTVPWHRLGENVGTGPTVDAVHNALVASPGHYRNLTDPGFRYVGVGVVNANGTTFVSEVFMEPASQPAPSTSTAAAGAPSSPPRSAQPVRTPPASAPAAPPAPPPPAPPVRVDNPWMQALYRVR
jgi:Cysteine-rich secretory protein family